MGESLGDVWKAIALVCITVLVAGAPGIVYAIRTWGIANEVHVIKERQDDVRLRLGILEERNTVLEEQVRELHAELLAHTSKEGAQK